MRADLSAASRRQYLALFDPAAIPAALAVDPDMLAQDPALMPKAAMLELAAAGDALILHIPTEDCEATIRLFVGEDPPEALRGKGAVVLSGAAIRVPSGRIRADGLEFMARPGELREHSVATEAAVPAGEYSVDVLNLQAWKALHRIADGRRGIGASARAAQRLVTLYTWLGILMLPANILLAPMLVLWLHRSRGWVGALAGVAIVVAVDAVVLGGFWLLQAVQQRLPVLTRVAGADAAFDRDHPDIVVVLRPGGAPQAAAPSFATVRFV